MERARPLDLSVVMVNWNSLEITAAALRTLREKTEGVAYEVILIDNGTTEDDSVARLPAEFPWVRFHAITPNRGFAHPNNLGIAMSTGRYVVLLNNDTVQTENALGKSVAHMDANPDVAVLGITHRNNDRERSLQRAYYDFPSPWRESAGLLGLAGRTRAPGVVDASAERDVDWVVGSYLFVRRSCLEDVGPLDERFFLYDEDMDWCLRAARKGYRIRFWPGAEMIHLGNGTRQWMKDKTFMHYRSHLTYLAKNHSTGAAIGFYLALSARLAGATTWQLLRLLAGRGSVAELRTRVRRQLGFVRLAATRTGN